MAISYVAGTSYTASAGDPTDPAWPAHAVGDVGILLVGTANQPIATPSGWTLIGSSGTGTPGTAGAVAIQVFYRIATTTSEAAAAIPDSGDITIARLQVYRGVDQVQVIDGTPSTSTQTANTAVTLPAVTTNYSNSMVVVAVATDADTPSNTFFSGWTNANLSSLTERLDRVDASATGVGLGCADGTKSTAGSSGTTAVTQASSEITAHVTFALREAFVINDATHAHTTDNVVVFIQENLVVADTAHTHTVDSLTLSLQEWVLFVADTVHVHTADSLTLTTGTVSWTQVGAVLEASDAADEDRFGIGIALSRDGLVMAVGAFQWEVAGTGRGGVYIYDWSGSAWVQRGAVLEASDAADNDQFGSSVALSADGLVLAVGAITWEGATGTDRGGVYIYDWSGSAWVQRGAVLGAADAADGDRFGVGVALSADGLVLAVGADAWEGATGTDRGGVYIYDRSGSAWVQRGAVLEASDAADADRFGISVALSADGLVLAVGALLWEGATDTDRGGVYIYDWSGSAWVQRGAVLEASDAANSDQFGRSVVLSADGLVLAVGAFLWEATGTDRGGVYIYDWSGSAWVQRGAVLEASDAANSDQFGVSVALSGDGRVLAAGANLWEGATGVNRGGVYSYLLVSQDVLFVADTAHTHTADSLTLSLAGGDLLVVADTAHAHTADSLTLSLTGSDLLVVADTAHTHTADSLTLSLQDVLVVADTVHTHTVPNIILVLDSFLDITEILHNHVVDNVNVNTIPIQELAQKYVRVRTMTYAQRVNSKEFLVHVLS